MAKDSQKARLHQNIPNVATACSILLVIIFHHSHGAFHRVDLSHLAKDSEPDPMMMSDINYAEKWITKFYDPPSRLVDNADQLTKFEFAVNTTDENEDATVQVDIQTSEFAKIMAEQMKKLPMNGTSVEIKRLYKKITDLGQAALSALELLEFVQLIKDMSSTLDNATVCFDEALVDDCPDELVMELEPNITSYMSESRNADKLRYVWKSFHQAAGRKSRNRFIRYVELKNKIARLNGYADAGKMWLADYAEPTINYTDTDVQNDLAGLLKQMNPLYTELHTYVRRKLIEQYPTENIKADGPIPIHLIGELSGVTWEGLLNFTQLFPNKANLDITEAMKRQNYTAKEMFRLSEAFQTGLGLEPMPASYWAKSVFENPSDGSNTSCDATTYDMVLRNDIRTVMCAEVNMRDLVTIYNVMGHSQYMLQYRGQHEIFQDAAHAGFGEAVGDTFALSMSTPKHLSFLGLLNSSTFDFQDDLNYLFKTALDKVAFLPYGYTLDRYRYDVFAGKIPKSRLNSVWWGYVRKYQGLAPPVERTERDFDPGAKFHVVADVEYMRYFIGYVLEFQFHKALCHASGHTGPLHQCDIKRSKAAGKLLKSMLSLGSSQPWPVALQKITGTNKMNASAMLEFFEPLRLYLHEINVKNNEHFGWKFAEVL